MYIFELLANAFKSKKYRRFEYADDQNEARYLAEETENCEHVFLPIDSTNTMFACKFCGLMVSKDKLKDRNIFRN